MRPYFRTGARVALAAVAAFAIVGLKGIGTAEAAPLGAAAGTHVADVATTNAGVEKVHRRGHYRHYRPWRHYGYRHGYRPYYGYPYRRNYGFYGGYPYRGYYGGYGYRHRPGVYLRFGF